MKLVKKHISILLLCLLALSCVKDDGVFEETPPLDMRDSIAITTILTELKGSSMESEADMCFRFQYPLTCGYNTDAKVKIMDYSGFEDVVLSQVSAFNVTSIVYPFSVVFNENEEVVEITNEQKFLDVLVRCDFLTLRNKIDQFLNTCFVPSYPINLIAVDNKRTSVTDSLSFRGFLESQGAAYQPNFMFPFDVVLLENTMETVRVNSNFDLLSVLEGCNDTVPTEPTDCPKGTFDITPFGGDFSFVFDALDVDPLSSSYEWSVNGVVIDSLNDQKLVVDYVLMPGTYEICLKSNFDVEGCDTEVVSCQEYVVDEKCPEISYTRSITTDLLEGNDLLVPVTRWFVDGQEVIGITDVGLFLTELKLEDGVYEICMEVAPDAACTETRRFCDMIEIDYCPPPLSFTFEPSATLTYTFEANFPERNEVDYEWRVDKVTIEMDGGATPDSDNLLSYTFPSPGTYEVCMFKINGPRCESPEFFTEFCQTIIVL